MRRAMVGTEVSVRQHCGLVASGFRVKMDLDATADIRGVVKKYPACLMGIGLPGTPRLHHGKAAYTSLCGNGTAEPCVSKHTRGSQIIKVYHVLPQSEET